MSASFAGFSVSASRQGAEGLTVSSWMRAFSRLNEPRA